ncbi:type II secretion system protein F [Vibrio parahaemolyticus]|nr:MULTISPECIES: type II secretion system F family protein [Vibrio harveyi group]KJQ87193.1 type II secretion system protein F [Vibrio sp. S512-13]KJQ92747.1 type II secretion system protein F [Vibrio sp. S457-15]BDP36029.1 TadB involved in pilus formation and/or protein secretion [Vibrio alginolyticus]EGR1224761.1 type II secretion system protein F [Vibrio parahaemolyticus]EHA6957748.1 type II secretion system protein F [Vibrio parahaemolyticus]
MILWISFILFCVAILFLLSGKKSKVENYFPEVEVEEDIITAINLNVLIEQKPWQRFKNMVSPAIKVLGPRAYVIIFIFLCLSAYISYYVVYQLLNVDSRLMSFLIFTFSVFWGYFWLQNRRRLDFEKKFPDALNILMSAVTAGESLMHAFSFVGENMDGEVGREFREMGERLKLGENPEKVLLRSCKAFPYPEYVFFTITVRANLNRGGQLKHVLARLIRILVDARTLESKKMAMTSEARISAKVVAAIPLVFAIIISQINPDHIEFVLNDPRGQLVLYYVVGSELIGLFIVWLLVKGVRR